MKKEWYRKLFFSTKYGLLILGAVLALILLLDVVTFNVQLHTPIFFLITLTFGFMQYFESRIKPVNNKIIRIDKPDIYEKIKETISRTKRELLVCSPVFQFGDHTYGLTTTNQVHNLILRIFNEGKAVRLVLDVNSVASAFGLYTVLKQSDFKLKCRFHKTNDFFFICDGKEMIIFKEPLRRHNVYERAVKRTIKLTPNQAFLVKDPREVAEKVQIFERYWQEGTNVRKEIRHFLDVEIRALEKVKPNLSKIKN